MKADELPSTVPDEELRNAIETVSVAKDRRIASAAHRLAIDFADDADLPARYKKSSTVSGKARKKKSDSEIQKRFQSNVKAWRQLIETVLAKIDERQAWRFIDGSPEIDDTMKKVTDSRDFCDFADYLALRRDQECCGSEELGSLAMLLTAFQRAVEKHLQ
jgi:hypothetical protein